MSENTWIGVDVDGTLAEYTGWRADGSIGPPIPKMIARVKAALRAGVEVRIVTARACLTDSIRPGSVPELDWWQVKVVQDWCEQHIGVRLPVQFWKDYAMIELWDDRARQVVPNTGMFVGEDGFGE